MCQNLIAMDQITNLLFSSFIERNWAEHYQWQNQRVSISSIPPMSNFFQFISFTKFTIYWEEVAFTIKHSQVSFSANKVLFNI